MDAVLGVSLTPSTVGLVLVEGSEADGATVDHDSFDIRGYTPSRTGEICVDVVTAVRRAERVAAEHGLQLTAIGVTWSSAAAAEAAVLLKMLAEAGFDAVVPVRLPQATDALARRIADIVGFDTTSVCVLEPDVVLAMTVGEDHPVQTTVSRGVETVAGLSAWLSESFEAAHRRPDALVVVGSAVDLDSVLPKLEQALVVPVFTPTEPGLPLARGAALASTRRGRLGFGGDGADIGGARWSAKQLVPLTVLVTGVLAFAVSLSLAVGQQLLPGSEPTPHLGTRPVVSTSGGSVSVHQTSAVTTPVPAVSISEPMPDLEPVPEAQPEYVVDQSTMAPSENAALPEVLIAPPAPELGSVPPPSPEHPAAPLTEAAQQPLPADQVPPPVPEAPPPVMEPAGPVPEVAAPVPAPAEPQPAPPVAP